MRTPCVHTCTPATWGAGPWAPRKSARVTGLRGEPHCTRGARSHRGVLLQLFSQLALASGTHGPGAPRSAGPRPFPEGAPLWVRAGQTSRVQGGLHGRPGFPAGPPSDVWGTGGSSTLQLSLRARCRTDGRGATPLPQGGWRPRELAPAS